MLGNVPQELLNDDQALRELLKTDWILSTMLNLEKVRKDAQYSQKELAQRLGTTQSVISRTESDSTGAISVRRYVEWLLACGAVPMELTFDPWSKVKAQAYMSQDNGEPILRQRSVNKGPRGR